MNNTKQTNKDYKTIRQSIYDFSEDANKLRLKKLLFNQPERILDMLDGLSVVSEETISQTREKVKNIVRWDSIIEGLKSDYEEENFGYKSVNGNLDRCITDFSYAFDEQQISDLKDLPELIRQFYIDRIDLLQNNSEIRELFGVEDDEIIFRLEVPLFTRLDMVEDKSGDLKLVEIEPIYAGIGETVGTRNIYNKNNSPDLNFPGLLSAYIEALERFKAKNILFCPNSGLKNYFTEVQYLYNQLIETTSGFESIELSLDERELDIRDDGVYFNGKKVEVLMNYFIPKERKEVSDIEKEIILQFKKGNIKLFPEPSLDLDSKLWLALAGDEKYFNNTELYDRFIPETIIYDQESNLPQDKMLKRVSSRVVENGEDKDDFFDTTDQINEEKESIIKQDNEKWIAQDKLETKKNELVLLNKKKKRLEEQSYYSRIELYLFFGENKAEFGDVLVTMGPNQIVKGSKDSVMVPAVTKK